MNAKIGRDNQHYERIVMGKYAIGERNDKGESLRGDATYAITTK